MIRIAQQVKEREVCQEHKKAQKEGEVVDMIGTLFKEYKEQGKIEGKIEAGRESLLVIFPQKLGPMPAEIESAIRALNDLNRMRNIVAHFMEINNWQQLQQYLN